MKKFILLLAIFYFLFSALGVHAGAKLEVGIPGPQGLPAGQSVSGPAEYINYLYLFVLGFVGIAGLITLVIWGTVWVASGIVDQKARAMEGIKNAITGILIALVAFIFLNTINPDLTKIKLPQRQSISVDATPSPSAGTSLTCCFYEGNENVDYDDKYQWECVSPSASSCGSGWIRVSDLTQCQNAIGNTSRQCNPEAAYAPQCCKVGGSFFMTPSQTQWICVAREDYPRGGDYTCTRALGSQWRRGSSDECTSIVPQCN